MSKSTRLKPEFVQQAVQDRKWIDDDTGLEQMSETLNACSVIGFDTEFVRDRTFFPKPGLLQVSDGHSIWLVDPIALADSTHFRSWLADCLTNPAQAKILHSVGEDFEVLELLSGVYPSPLFDTQIAAALLGFPLQMRYEALAEALIDIQFAGGLARNNWCRRPLPAEWSEYAAHDVIALPAMQTHLTDQLEQIGRLQWHTEDCARSVQRAQTRPDPLLRIKAATRLDDPALAKLSQLVKWREHQARQRDLPRSFVAKDRVLITLSKQRPETMQQLEKIEDMHKGFIRRYGTELLALIAEDPIGFERPPELRPLTTDQQNAIKATQKTIRTIAEQLNIEAPLLASRRDLTQLILTGQSDWLNGWRGEVLDGALDPVLTA